MTVLLIVSAVALLAAITILIFRYHATRDFDELLGAVRIVDNTTRESLDRAAAISAPPGLKNWSDLAIFLWNSRLFVQMGNQVALSAGDDIEVKSLSADIREHNKNLRKLVVFSYAEKVMGVILLMRTGYYQNRTVACYAEAEDLLYYLVSYWRPQSEGALGERI